MGHDSEGKGLFSGLDFIQTTAFTLTVVQEKVLHVAVWDWDRLSKNDFIGSLSIPVRHIESAEVDRSSSADRSFIAHAFAL